MQIGRHLYLFRADVAYHVINGGGFRKAINVQGSDHYGTVARVRAGLQTRYRHPQGYPDYVLHKMVRVMRGGGEVKVQRAGSYVTVRDLIDWVGRDAVRFFLVSRKADSEFVFDIDLALAQAENPVYYVQYAHARVCSVLRQLEEKQLSWNQARGLEGLHLLNEAQEQQLIARLGLYPETLELAALAHEPHQLAYFLRELANDFHVYYNAHQFIVEDEALREARLTLIVATRQVLAGGLALLGVSAPELM